MVFIPMKIIVLIIGTILFLFFYSIMTIFINKVRRTNRQQKSIARKLLRLFLMVIYVIFSGLALGFQIENIWLTVGGIAGVIAIGFFAVWSILSNVICAFILFVTTPYKIDDYIRIDDLEGYVEEITMFYTILKNKKGDYVHIPNNLMFQKPFLHVVEK